MTACTGIQSASGPVLSGSLRSADGSPAANRTIIATQILLQGRVQGLGVRPAIAKLAIRLKLHGSVTNTPDGVLIHLEGLGSELIRFQALLAHELPPQADVLVGPIVDVPVTGRQEFTILAGADTAVAGHADGD